MTPKPAPTPARRYLLAGLVRLALFGLLWLILAEGSTYNLPFALLVCLLATALSLALVPPLARSLSITATLRFVPFFLVQTVLGGFDVARRAVRPRLDLQPTFLRHPLQLPPGPAQLFFASLISLLPGTVACRLRDDSLEIHVLDQAMNVTPVLRKLETHAARIFRL